MKDPFLSRLGCFQLLLSYFEFVFDFSLENRINNCVAVQCFIPGLLDFQRPCAWRGMAAGFMGGLCSVKAGGEKSSGLFWFP